MVTVQKEGKEKRMTVSRFALLIVIPFVLLAQERNPTQGRSQQTSNEQKNPIFRVQVVSHSIQAVSYRDRAGWTKIDFQGTSISPQSKGTAEVRSQQGGMQIKLDIKKLPSPTSFGKEFLTYVLWAITPDGHAANLTEVKINSDGSYSNDNVFTTLQSFGLIITAEPYWAVRIPSDVVAMENIVRKDTLGKVEVIDAKYELLQRGQYVYNIPESEQHPVILGSDRKSLLDLYEAMNAVQIARYAKADQHGGETFQDAVRTLEQAENYRARKQWSPANMTAREAVQKAADSRDISLQKQRQLALEEERRVAAERQAAEQQKALLAQQNAAEEARQRALADEQAKREAEQRAEAERARAEADVASAKAAAEAEKAQQAAAEADRLRQQAIAQREALRAQLLQQFNSVLPTRETPRGLVVNMQDVLFDFGKYNLRDTAREALAKISGIVISHPGLNLQVEGYTDSVGSDEYNQKLSENRANTVRDYLEKQGITAQSLSAVGYGKNYPVASNDKSAGRQLNRRVELVVSGEVIGAKIGVPPSAGQGPGTPIPPPGQPTAPIPPAAPAPQSAPMPPR
jgi:outer membrane protein OmpA-like peptidoglycan-associated protein